MRVGCVALALLAASLLARAQDRVAWSLQAPEAAAPGSALLIRATARILPGWHLYSASSPAGIPASFQVEPGEAVRVYQPPPKREFDKNLNAESETYEGEVIFLVEARIPAATANGPATLTVKTRFQTCNDAMCVPGRWTGTVPLRIDPAAKAAATIPAGYAEAKPPAPGASAQPVAPAQAEGGWLPFLAVAFGFGLASLFTPCVFPMIPITMSYFLNRKSEGKADGVAQAVVFCLGIIVLFSGLGLLVTALLGPFGVVQLGSNPWVNGFIAALFMAFGLSLLGAFEITVPSSILTRLNASSGSGGFAGTLLMGLTFSLASFACVGPFVGTLLAASVTSGGIRPLAGMASFAAGLAAPFFLLALFPSYLKRLPKSGAWMARVKVVMGFVILAASLKYLSNLDLVMRWGLITRERFLAVWVVLFGMAGLYLLGLVRLEGIKPDEPMTLKRLIPGMAFLAFALSLLPGMLGGRLGELDAFVPQPEADAVGSPAVASGQVWIQNDYRGALARARSEGKLVLVTFTGYACTNCHWMKANMFTKPEIAQALGGFVLVELYTDGTDAVSEQNAQLELSRFQTTAIPLYALMDPDGNVLASFTGVTRDPAVYLAFLAKGTKPASPEPAPAPQSAAAPVKGELPKVNALNGGAMDTAALSGKIVVVNFWATWCAPCVQEIPGFNKLHREFGPKGVAVLGISMDDEGKAVVDPFLKDHPMEYPVGLGTKDSFEKYGLESLPVTIIYDRSGNPLKRFDGFTPADKLEAAVRAAL